MTTVNTTETATETTTETTVTTTDTTANVTPEPTHCAVDFSASTTSGQAPLTVTFTSTTSCDAQKRIWNFGDGGPEAAIEGGPTETYTYNEPGTYTVRLEEKLYGTGAEDFYLGTEEKVGYIHVTTSPAVNPSLRITNLPDLDVTQRVTLVRPDLTLRREIPEVVDPVGPVQAPGA